MPSSVRDYAVLYLNAKVRSGGAIIGGGNSILATGQHALDGPEHTEATLTDRLLATINHSGLIPPISGDPADALHGDLTWRPVSGPSFYDGALSHPPTEAELETLLGAPSAHEGEINLIGDTGSGLVRYVALSDGALWFLLPVVRPVSSGGGGPLVLTLTSAPEGGWSWFEDPRALAHGTYTYVGYNQGGNLKIAVVHSGALVNTITVAAALEYDDHDTPTFYVDPINDKLIVFYSKHLGPNLYMRKSTNTLTSDPTLSGGFAAASDLAPTFEVPANRVITYPSPLYTNNADGSGDDTLWLFYRCHMGGTDAEWHYTASTTAGVTWGSAGIRLHTLTYSKIESDGVGRIDLACSDHANEGATKIYHLYRETGAWRKSDGTTIPTGPTDLPLDGADLTTVYSASGTDLVWIADIATDGAGHPVVVFARYPSGSTSDIRYMYARWTGSAWSVHEICAAGGYIPDASVGGNPLEVYYHGGLSLDHDDPQIVYCGREISGQWEVFRYVTADGGATFANTQLTTASVGKQVRPVGVRSQADIAAVWMDGTYHSYVDYSVGTKGYAP